MSKKLPTAKKPQKPQQSQLLAHVAAKETRFIGPIPPPELMKAYNEVLPDAAHRILLMAEEQSRHRQAFEMKSLEGAMEAQRSQKHITLLGIASGLVVAVAFGGLAAYLAMHDKTEPALVLGSGTSIAAVIAALLYMSRRRQASAEAGEGEK